MSEGLVLTQKQIVRISKQWDPNFAPGDHVELRGWCTGALCGIVIGVEERLEEFALGQTVKKSKVHVMWTLDDGNVKFGTYSGYALFHIVNDDDE